MLCNEPRYVRTDIASLPLLVKSVPTFNYIFRTNDIRSFDVGKSEKLRKTISVCTVIMLKTKFLSLNDRFGPNCCLSDEGIWMQDLDIWKSYSTMSPRESSGDSASEIAFLVNGCDVYSVSGSRYIAVLPFAYFPSLHAVALEFPLDVSRNESSGALYSKPEAICLKINRYLQLIFSSWRRKNI